MRRIGTIFLTLSLLLSCIGNTSEVAAASSPFQVSGTILEETSARLGIQAAASDPYYSSQWYLNRIQVPQAWDITTGGATTIAVVDTGVNGSHPELTGRLWVNSDEIPDNNRDDDSNGYVDDYQGYNFVNDNDDISDDHGHGTGIASVIAANTNNGVGIAGIDRIAKIMAVKALDTAGGGDYSNVIKATRYAVDNGANIINMSFGAAGSDGGLKDAINYATSRNVIIVAASGNAGQNQVYYPAAYSSVIAVGSVGRNDVASSFSNKGSQLDVVAPGEDIVIANHTGGYNEASGSSFSAALVSGAVSLLLSVSPGLTPLQVSELLNTTSTPVGSVTPSPEYGYGIVNAYSLVNRPKANLRATFNTPTSASANGVDVANVVATVTANNQPQANVPITAQLSGNANIINGQPSSTLYIGSTNNEGKITIALSSVMAETKQLNLTTTQGAFENSTTNIVFNPPINPSYQMQWISQSPYPNLALGERKELQLEVRNTGNIAWLANPDSTSDAAQLRLGTDRNMDRASALYDSTKWLSSNRVVPMTPSLVRPGETAQFRFSVLAPNQPGTFKEYFRPVVERVAWLNDLGIYWDITVGGGGPSNSPSDYQAQLISQSSDIVLSPGVSTNLTVEFKNTGTTTWSPLGQGIGVGRVKLGTWNPQDRSSKLATPQWLSPNRVTDSAIPIAPGETLRLSFPITAPSTPARYTESFHLVSEFVAWFGPAVTWNITVS